MWCTIANLNMDKRDQEPGNAMLQQSLPGCPKNTTMLVSLESTQRWTTPKLVSGNLPYSVWTTTFIVESCELWLVSTLPCIGKWALIPSIPSGSLHGRNTIKGSVETADSSADQLRATITTSEFSGLTSGNTQKEHVCCASYLEAQCAG